MKFKLVLRQKRGSKIPFNYQYPLSSAIYKFIKQADQEYAEQLHQKGFGKGFKFFTFSDLNFKEVKTDKEGFMISDGEILLLYVDIYLPKTAQSLIKGIFENKEVTIANSYHKTDFSIASVEIMEDRLKNIGAEEIVKVEVKPTSPIVIGRKNVRGNYDYLLPMDDDFEAFMLKNWEEKLRVFNVNIDDSLRSVEIKNADNVKTRLIVLKADTLQETKVKGSKNYTIELIGKKKEIELLMAGGLGLHNAQGMGSVKIIE